MSNKIIIEYKKGIFPLSIEIMRNGMTCSDGDALKILSLLYTNDEMKTIRLTRVSTIKK